MTEKSLVKNFEESERRNLKSNADWILRITNLGYLDGRLDEDEYLKFVTSFIPTIKKLL